MLAIRILWLQAALVAAQLLDLSEAPVVGPLLGGNGGEGESSAVPSAITEPIVEPSDTAAASPVESAVLSVGAPSVTIAPAPVISVEPPAPAPSAEEPAAIPSPSSSPEPVVEPEPTLEEPTTVPAPVIIPTTLAPTIKPGEPTVQLPTVVAPAPDTSQAQEPAPAATTTIVPVQEPAQSPSSAAGILIPTVVPAAPVVPASPVIPTSPAAPSAAAPGSVNGGNGGNGGTPASGGNSGSSNAGVAVFNPPSAAVATPATPAITTPAATQPAVTQVVTAEGGNTLLSVFVPPTAAAAALQPSFAADGTFVNPTVNPGSGSASDVFPNPNGGNNGGRPVNPNITQTTVDNSNRLSQGTKIGIGLGAAGGTIALVAGVVYLFWKRRMRVTKGHRLSDGSDGFVPVSEKQKMGWEAEHGNANFDFGFQYREREMERERAEKQRMEGRVELEGDSLPPTRAG